MAVVVQQTMQRTSQFHAAGSGHVFGFKRWFLGPVPDTQLQFNDDGFARAYQTSDIAVHYFLFFFCFSSFDAAGQGFFVQGGFGASSTHGTAGTALTMSLTLCWMPVLLAVF